MQASSGHAESMPTGSIHRPRLRNEGEAARRAREVLDRIGDKWSLEVIHHLRNGSTRFMGLKRSIDGISQRMLTVSLRGLERDGLVRRTVHPEVPPRVEYELTPLGETLLEKVCGLVEWADEHLYDIARAQRSFDGRHRGPRS
jgi:DNA-binding HxlR family transcriptional regulator